MSRPSLFDEQKMDLICKAVEVGATRKIAAEAAGISVATLYAWLAKGRNTNDPNDVFFKFLERIKKANSICALRDLSIITRASETDWRAAAWRLERRHGYIVGQPTKEEESIDAVELDVNSLIDELNATKDLIASFSGPTIDINES